MKKDFSSFGLDPKVLEGCEFHDNITQVFIRTTEDKLRNILRDFKEAYATKYSWTTPLGLFLSFLATVITATFADKYGVTKAYWEALFTLFAVGSFLWFACSAWNAISKRKETSLQFIIDKIKDSVQQSVAGYPPQGVGSPEP